MTNDQINEKVAKLGGWVKKFPMGKSASVVEWIDPTGVNTGLRPPNYAESLDACRGFESTFDPNDSSEYAVQLRRIVTRNSKDIEKHPDTGYIPDGRYYCAAPIERCEAFLRLKGQWE